MTPEAEAQLRAMFKRWPTANLIAHEAWIKAQIANFLAASNRTLDLITDELQREDRRA